MNLDIHIIGYTNQGDGLFKVFISSDDSNFGIPARLGFQMQNICKA